MLCVLIVLANLWSWNEMGLMGSAPRADTANAGIGIALLAIYTLIINTALNGGLLLTHSIVIIAKKYYSTFSILNLGFIIVLLVYPLVLLQLASVL